MRSTKPSTDPRGARRRAFARALRLACPRCGARALFRRWARLAARCPGCGLVLRRESGAQTGSMYVSAAVTELFAVLVIAALWFLWPWGVASGLAVGIPVVLGFSYAFLPWSMALWVAAEYATDVANREPWTVCDEGRGA
jgi:uncharacterized protein (DUF983 family)